MASNNINTNNTLIGKNSGKIAGVPSAVNGSSATVNGVGASKDFNDGKDNLMQIIKQKES